MITMGKKMRKLVTASMQIIMFLVVVISSFTALAAETETSCVTCHSSQRFFVENKKLYNYYRDWLGSPHKEAGLSCFDCHGGDPAAAEKSDAHRGMYPPSDPRSRVNYRNQVATCGGNCHGKEAEQFKASKHYRRLQDQNRLGVPSCSTCHRVMNRKPYYGEIVEITCQVCHYEGNEQDLPLVTRRADETLHRLNIAKGYLNWTRLYYESENWPGNSRREVEAVEEAYQKILANIHRFHITRWGWDTIDLLTELKRLYKQAGDNEFGEQKNRRPQ